MWDFNPRAPHGARRIGSRDFDLLDEFQSTRSAWSATAFSMISTSPLWYFTPRAPHGARPVFDRVWEANTVFQSTRSAWSATRHRVCPCYFFPISIHALRMERDPTVYVLVLVPEISIHALRMERDVSIKRYPGLQHNFNPRAPHGARRASICLPTRRDNFNPRAPHGARRLEEVLLCQGQNFNPRAPHGARQFPMMLPALSL